MWFRWEGDDLKPIESFELANGRITVEDWVPEEGVRHAELRLGARGRYDHEANWDLARYPARRSQARDRDRGCSDQDTRTAVFEADTENSSINPDLQVSGWEVAGIHSARDDTTLYSTNYGDPLARARQERRPTRATASRSRSQRLGFGRFIKVFFGLFLSALISWCAFWVRLKLSSPRVSLGVGATFAAAAVTVSINNSLPDTNAVTMADKLIMLTLGIIVASVAETITALTLNARGKEVLQQRLDRICAFAFPAFYFAMIGRHRGVFMVRAPARARAYLAGPAGAGSSRPRCNILDDLRGVPCRRRLVLFSSWRSSNFFSERARSSPRPHAALWRTSSCRSSIRAIESAPSAIRRSFRAGGA